MSYEVIQWSKRKNYSYVVIEMPEKMVSMSEMEKKKERNKAWSREKERKKEFSKCLFMSCQHY